MSFGFVVVMLVVPVPEKPYPTVASTGEIAATLAYSSTRIEATGPHPENVDVIVSGPPLMLEAPKTYWVPETAIWV